MNRFNGALLNFVLVLLIGGTSEASLITQTGAVSSHAFGFGKAPPPGPNYATWNPSDKNAGISLSSGNLVFQTNGGGGQMVRGTVGLSSGKYYFELKQIGSGAGYICGLATAASSLSIQTGLDAFGWSYFDADGKVYNNGIGTAYGSTFSSSDTIGVAMDLGAGKIWFAINGVWQNSGDPAAGTNPAFSGLSGTFYPSCSGGVGIAVTGGSNFGATTFGFTVPVGFNSGWYD